MMTIKNKIQAAKAALKEAVKEVKESKALQKGLTQAVLVTTIASAINAKNEKEMKALKAEGKSVTKPVLKGAVTTTVTLIVLDVIERKTNEAMKEEAHQGILATLIELNEKL